MSSVYGAFTIVNPHNTLCNILQLLIFILDLTTKYWYLTKHDDTKKDNKGA